MAAIEGLWGIRGEVWPRTATARSQGVHWRVAARTSRFAVARHDRDIESCKAAVRAKVEHPFLIVKRDFGFTKTRYRGIAKNLNHLQILFASAN